MLDRMARVSIVMLSYNRPQLIGRAIESVVEQDFADWELLVVQDGANEFTIRTMQEWMQRDGRIRHLRRDKGGNIADATNYGLERAQGDYIAILDDDDYWACPDKLSRQVRFLDEHADYAGCGGGVIVVDPDGREQMRYRKPEQDSEIRRRALMANPMAHGAGMYRLSLLRDLGLYDVSLEGFQDWDVWLKLGGRGKLYNFPDFLLCYRVWQGSGSFHSSRGNTRSAIRIVKRHRGEYAGYAAALAMAYAYHGYNHLPAGIRKSTYSLLSRAKKGLFSAR
jgi:glycosyltransferase involved in cell wall biosynthesis